MPKRAPPHIADACTLLIVAGGRYFGHVAASAIHGRQHLEQIMAGRNVSSAAAAALWITLACTSPISAQEPEADKSADRAVWQAASDAMQKGPTTIELRDQAQLRLPAGYGFVPVKEDKAVMELIRNQTDERFLGLIFPTSAANWFVIAEYEQSGYIKESRTIPTAPFILGSWAFWR